MRPDSQFSIRAALTVLRKTLTGVFRRGKRSSAAPVPDLKPQRRRVIDPDDTALSKDHITQEIPAVLRGDRKR
jgi:hypothetical protein